MTPEPVTYPGCRFSAEIIGHAVWLHRVFSPSLRIWSAPAERGITATHESIRQWRLRFGAGFARKLPAGGGRGRATLGTSTRKRASAWQREPPSRCAARPTATSTSTTWQCPPRRRSAASNSAWPSSTAPRSALTRRRPGAAEKGAAPAQRDAREALGRSRGGYGTKACVIADAAGRAVAFALAPGQAHELPHAAPLLACLPDVPIWVVADRGQSSHAFREHVWGLGARPAVPTRRGEAPVACPEPVYNKRNRVERLWARLKEWRAVATRYEETARSFLGVSTSPPPPIGSGADRA